MSFRFSTEIQLPPSVQRFTNTIVDTLANHRSLLILLPNGVDVSDIATLIRTELFRRDFKFKSVYLSGNGRAEHPVIVMRSIIDNQSVDAEGFPDLRDLILAEENPDVFLIEGLEHLSPESYTDWLSFLSEWARVCQGVVGDGERPLALCLIVPAYLVKTAIPDSNVYLSINWWWGLPSSLEVHLLCRSKNEEQNLNATSVWRENILSALSCGDMDFVQHLWDPILNDITNLHEVLMQFAEMRGWNKGVLVTWGADMFLETSRYTGAQHSSFPPEKWHNLWANGVLTRTIEYGLELHAAALAQLDREKLLNHRLWRGQSRLLLPLVDQVRLTVCEHLTQRYGPDWPIRWELPLSEEEQKNVRKNPLACQLGYLDCLINQCWHLKKDRHFRSIIRRARWIRNEIAHYRPINFQVFQGFWQEMIKLK